MFRGGRKEASEARQALDPGNDPGLEMQAADPRLRRRVLLAGISCVAAAAILIFLGEAYRPALEEWLSRDPRGRLPLVLAGLLAIIALPTLGFAVHFWQLGGRIVGAERFPDPASGVIRDTVVLRGSAARRRGRVLQVCAAILAVAGLGLCFFLWRLSDYA